MGQKMKHLTFVSLVAVALAFFGAGALHAASLTITASQNWSAITTGSGAGGQPDSTDAITVQNGATLTVDVTTGACASIQLGGSGSAGTGGLTFQSGKLVSCAGDVILGQGNVFGTLNMFSGGTLKIGGTLTFTPGASSFITGSETIEYNAAGPQTITPPPATYNNWKTSGSGTKSLGGAVTLNGGLTISAGTTLDVTTANYALTVKRGWTNSGTFTARSGSVILRGTAAQSLIGLTTFNNFTLNNSASLTLFASITVN